jgi:tyrosine-protein phosphatase OCA6
MIHLKVDKMKEDNIPLTYSRTIAAIQTIIDPANLPIYIHCLDGSDVIGLVVGCLRKLEMWNTSSAMGEYLR